MASGTTRCVTGFCELLPLRLSHGYSLHDTLLTHVHSLMFFISCDDINDDICSGRSGRSI
jgi:hypothetical protein